MIIIKSLHENESGADIKEKKLEYSSLVKSVSRSVVTSGKVDYYEVIGLSEYELHVVKYEFAEAKEANISNIIENKKEDVKTSPVLEEVLT
jgi:hypothetical protein